jgi:hypothetical protein
MPIDLTQAEKVVPDALPATDLGDRINVANAESEKLGIVAGITAEKMPAVVAAGVELAKYVLAMVMASIVLLTIYLFVMDVANGRSLDRAYDSVFREASAGPDFPDVGEVERIAKLFAQAAERPDFTLTVDDERAGRSVVEALGRVAILSDVQRADLSHCLPLASGEQRVAVLTRCADTLRSLEKGAIGAAANLEKIKVLTDFAKVVNEHRQTFRTFWVQVAQLVLLNLLLPLLTALLGYIFGTNQGNKTTPLAG